MSVHFTNFRKELSKTLTHETANTIVTSFLLGSIVKAIYAPFTTAFSNGVLSSVSCLVATVADPFFTKCFGNELQKELVKTVVVAVTLDSLKKNLSILGVFVPSCNLPATVALTILAITIDKTYEKANKLFITI